MNQEVGRATKRGMKMTVSHSLIMSICWM
jgi:hypothetical protein